MLPKLDDYYRRGVKNWLIIGHNQSGAIAFLLMEHFYSLHRQEKLPADIRLKTYCSAGPKPGNLYYAYDYEAMTQGGWGFNAVNSADWVPEIPMSIQTTDDFNAVNPFVGIPQAIRSQKFFERVALNYAFGKLDTPTRKAQRSCQRFLGSYIEKAVKKNLPSYRSPTYYQSNHYVRTGQTVVLLANDAYYQQFPNDPKKLFRHHLLGAYMLLLNQLN